MTRTENAWRRAVFGLALAGLLSVLPGVPGAEAHHGWSSYNTQAPLYLEGTVAEVHWRNPHPELVVVIEAPAQPVDPSRVTLPSDAGADLRDALSRATPAAPGRYTVHLPPIPRLQRAGVTAPPQAGERFVAIAYASCSEAGTARAGFAGFANGSSAVQQVSSARGCDGAARS
ncbi:MAG: DUF6152 family protein [Alphaproteobacteria bacterium]